jgi:hypothetical protein
MTRTVHVSLLLFILIFGQKISTAQSCKSCFSELFIGVNYLNEIKKSSLKDIYKQTPFLGIKAGTYYLNGRIQLDVAYASYSSDLPYPPFKQLNITAGYERQFKLPLGFTLGPGFRIGNAYMMFDMPNIVSAISNESELLVGGYVSLEKRIGKHLSFATVYSFNRIYTSPRIDLQWLELHLYYYFKTPEGFKKWMD